MVALASAIRQGSRWEIRCSWPDRMHLCAHPVSAPSGNRLLTGLSTPSAHTGRAEHMGYVSHAHPTHSYTPHLASLQPHHTHIPPTPSHALVPSHTSHTSHSYMLTHTHTHPFPTHALRRGSSQFSDWPPLTQGQLTLSVSPRPSELLLPSLLSQVAASPVGVGGVDPQPPRGRLPGSR